MRCGFWFRDAGTRMELKVKVVELDRWIRTALRAKVLGVEKYENCPRKQSKWCPFVIKLSVGITQLASRRIHHVPNLNVVP